MSHERALARINMSCHTQQRNTKDMYPSLHPPSSRFTIPTSLPFLTSLPLLSPASSLLPSPPFRTSVEHAKPLTLNPSHTTDYNKVDLLFDGAFFLLQFSNNINLGGT